ncbi:PAS domain-containing protein [Methanolobus sp. ZRKC3]|uniref:PAS domain-containing protein n=1 Tax=Methanolobus sp. ZRKC3 TaxID=3125786 RepID=UPI00324C3C88
MSDTNFIEKKLEAVYNSSPVISFMWRATDNWPVESVSSNVIQLGYTPDDFLSGKLDYGHMLHPDDIERINFEVSKLFKNKNASYFSLNYRIITKSGDIRWVTERSFIIRDGNGNITHFKGIIIDNTELEKTERELLETGKKYQVIFEKSPLGIVYFDENGIITHCNDSFSRILESPKKDILGFNVLNSMKDDRMADAIGMVFLGKTGYFEGDYISSISGKRLLIMASFTPITSAAGALIGGIGILEDFGERKMVEDVLRLNELRLKALLELYQMQDALLYEIAEFTIEKAVELTGSKFGFLEFLNEDENVLEAYQWPPQISIMRGDQPSRYPVRATGFWGEAIKAHNKPVVENRHYTSEMQFVTYPESAGQHLFRHVTIPVFENEGLVAVLSVANKEQDYNESDVRQLTLFAEGMWKLVQYKKTSDVMLEAMKMRRVLESVMGSSPAVVFLWRAEKDWPVEFVSENVSQFGYNVNDFMSGKLIYGDIVHPSDLERVRQEVDRASKEGFSDFSQEYRILTKSGEVRWIDERTMIHYNMNGIVDYLQGIVVDVTERKQANSFMRLECDLDNVLGATEDLHETFERLLSFTLETKRIDNGAIYLVDEVTGDMNLVAHRGFSSNFVEKLSHFNKNMVIYRLFMTGYPVYKNFSELNAMVPKGGLGSEELQAMAFIPVKFDDDIVAAMVFGSSNGLEIPANSRNLIETIAGQVGIIISRVKKDHGSHRNKKHLGSLLDALDEIIFIMDMQGKILHINQSLQANLNYSAKDLYNKDFLILYPEGWEDDVLSNLDEIMEGKSLYSEIPFVSKEGILIPVKTKFTVGEWGEQGVLIATASVVDDSVLNPPIVSD